LSVCSTTLWVGHLSKLVQQEELSDTFGKYGDIVSIDMIPPRGCAYIVMNRRQDAFKAMQSLKNHKMQNRAITISWAAGKGVKSKEWKDYFDQSLGCTYVPNGKLTHATDFVALEEGGMYDEDSMPAWVKEKIKQQNQPAVSAVMQPQFFPAVDTSQPPPNASMLPTMPPFRPMLMAPGLMGLGVPPPNMMLPGMLQLPPGLIPGMGFAGGMAAAAAAATQQVMAGQQAAAAGDDHMDIEMEDETSGKNDFPQFYNQPPPMNAMMMAGNQGGEKQGDDFSRMNRNNRSQSREKDGRGDFRSRGPRDRNDRRSDFNNRNSRWPNDSNGRERSRSRDGEEDLSWICFGALTVLSHRSEQLQPKARPRIGYSQSPGDANAFDGRWNAAEAEEQW
jgi:RNA recognition motif-containing protein